MKNLVYSAFVFLSVACSANQATLTPLQVKAPSETYLEAGEARKFTVHLGGGATYLVRAEALDRGADLECSLYDSNGDLVSKGVVDGYTCTTKVTPKEVAPYTFEVKNSNVRGSAYQIEAL